MNTKTFFAAAVAAFGAITTLGTSSAFAGEASYEYPVTLTSNVSRADVKAQTLQAHNAGLIASGEKSIVIADTGPALSRAQVKAEALEAIRVGALGGNEESVAPTAAQLESIRMAGRKAAAMTMASL